MVLEQQEREPVEEGERNLLPMRRWVESLDSQAVQQEGVEQVSDTTHFVVNMIGQAARAAQTALHLLEEGCQAKQASQKCLHQAEAAVDEVVPATYMLACCSGYAQR